MVFLFVLRLREVWKVQGGFKIKFDAFTDPPFFKLLWFIGAAVLVYFLTYIPYLLMGYSLGYIFQLQGDMYIYHSTLNATHPFSSAWWSWPLIQRPVWLFVSTLPKGFESTIAVFGNPAVWWVGFACIFLVTERAVRGKELALQLWKMFTKRLQAGKRKMPFFSRISALMKKEPTHRPSVAENASRGWDSAAIFIAGMLLFPVASLRLDFEINLHLPLLHQCAVSLFSLSVFSEQVLE